MKNSLFLLLFLMGFQGFTQTTIRQPISGKVVLPVEEDLSGINVVNINTNQAAVTDVNGNFQIKVADKDSVQVSSVQFKPFTVIVDQTVIASKKMYIYVNEVVNELPEVVVSPNKLTGNLSSDIQTLQVVTFPQKLTKEARDLYADYGSDYKDTRPLNRAMLSSYTHMVDGLNFVNLFKLLLVNSKHDEVNNPYGISPHPVLSKEIRNLYNDDFFRENLDIRLENIGEFIQYADDNGLSEQMLKKGNELDLIQFLEEQSKKFKKMKSKS
ncbi:MAG: carboxypeptidase-like regulatory domain-containing protein [Gillisia sp.]